MIKDLIENSDSILSIRQDLGAQKHNVYILKRSWSDGKVGEGIPTDTIEKLNPSPNVQEFPHDIEVRSGGKILGGDIRLKMVSKKNHTREYLELKNTPDQKGVERFYYINGKLYSVVGIMEYQIHYDISLRKTTNSKVYLDGDESSKIE